VIREFFRLRFFKKGDVRFTSHRDLMRVYARALRRAALPLAMSRGFNPRPRISIPAPLSVGFTGLNEVMDMELCRWCRPSYVREKLNEHLPDGIGVLAIKLLDAKPGRRPGGFSYVVPLAAGHPIKEEALDRLREQESLEINRSNDKDEKRKDIAPFIRQLRLQGDRLLVHLKFTDRGTARPEEVLNELGCEPHVHYLSSAIIRTHVNMIASP